MPSRECVWCEVCWPLPGGYYVACPQCRENTQLSDKPPTYLTEEASAIHAEMAFGWWLWDTGRL